MTESTSTENLLSQIEELQNRLAESEQLIEAIKAGEVDAFAVNKNNRREVFTLQSGDYAYRILIENISEGALNLSEDGIIVYTNNYFHQILQLPYEKVISSSIFNFIHPSSKDIFKELFKKGLAGEAKGEINLAAGEKIISVYVSLTSLQPALQTVGMIVTDLTEKKKQEKFLEQQNNELAHNRNFISNILKSTNHGVLSYVAIRNNNKIVDFEVRYANDIALEQLNMPAEKVIGSTYLTIIPDAKEQGYFQRIERVLTTRISETHEIISPAFPDRHFKAQFVHLDDGVTVTFIDISQEKQHALQLEEKNRELESVNKELQAFTYISSHDLQEPLRKIQTFATRILEKENENLSATGKEYFTRMQNAANRMQSLIDDLLAYSQVNPADHKLENVNLNDIIEEIKQDLKEELKEKNAVITVAGKCKVNIIRFQFQQLLYNLFSNSLKFSRPGITPLIEIKNEMVSGSQSPFKDKAACHIFITDNGIGFEPDYEEKIFELFYRLHGKDEYNGTGIGLAIVKKIVENHKGIITASSQPNKGARFDIYIPQHVQG